jgi:polar amino acid transport system ATP-binding protein
MALLDVKNLSKSFGSAQVLRDVSFSLEKGQTLAIIGSSGSGKTTLLRCLTGLENADSGEILLPGGGELGLVFQNFNLFPQYTAAQNVALAPTLRKQLTKEQAKEEALQWLAQVGLSERADAYPWQLSGGQQQRVAIARALALKPEILCFDEPTSALDPELTGEVLKVIRDLAARNTTMIIVTHEMAFARDVADYLIFMDGGVIVEQGSAKDVINDPKHERTKAFLSGYSNRS